MEIKDTFTPEKGAENVILVDGDFADKVAFDLTVNFERIIGRRIPKADLARWADCLALDGGLREGQHDVSLVIIHDKQRQGLDNFTPGRYADELNGQAFRDHLGEFSIMTLPVEETLTDKAAFFRHLTETLVNSQETRRLMLVPDESYFDEVRQALRHADEDKHVTVFSMQPMAGGAFRQEILGYSLMCALGIESKEIPTD